MEPDDCSFIDNKFKSIHTLFLHGRYRQQGPQVHAAGALRALHQVQECQLETMNKPAGNHEQELAKKNKELGNLTSFRLYIITVCPEVG